MHVAQLLCSNFIFYACLCTTHMIVQSQKVTSKALMQCCQVVCQENLFSFLGGVVSRSIARMRAGHHGFREQRGFGSRDCLCKISVARTKERMPSYAFLLAFCMSHSHAGTVVASEERTSTLYPYTRLLHTISFRSVFKHLKYRFIHRPGNNADSYAIV